MPAPGLDNVPGARVLGLLPRWSDFARSDLAPTTARQYRRALLAFVAFLLEEGVEANAESVARYLATLGNHGPARTVSRQALRHFFRWAKNAGEWPDDPTAVLPRIRRTKRPPDFLTEEELCQLVYAAATYSPEWAWSMVFMVNTGARVSEACAVTPGDISLMANTVSIRDTKTGIGRVIHLGTTGRNAVNALLDGRPTLLGIKPGAMWRRMKVLATMTGIPAKKMHPHTLRHTCGTLLFERGASQPDVMARLGHTDPAQTTWYEHVTSERAKGTAELI